MIVEPSGKIYGIDFSDIVTTMQSIENRIVAKIEFAMLDVDELPNAIKDSLGEQGVSLADVDYMLLTYNIDLFNNVERELEFTSEGEAQRVLPEDYNIERLLPISNDSRWYRVKIYGMDAILGIAYH